MIFASNGDDTKDTVLIENNEFDQQWVAIIIWSNSNVCNENSIAGIIADIDADAWGKRVLILLSLQRSFFSFTLKKCVDTKGNESVSLVSCFSNTNSWSSVVSAVNVFLQ